jgi:hypothetical protein
VALIIAESQGLISAQEVSGARAVILPLSVNGVSEAVKSAASSSGFRQIQFRSQGTEGQYQGKKRIALTHIRVQEETSLLVRWRGSGRDHALIEWVAYVQNGFGQPFVDQNAGAEFARWLEGAVRLAMTAPRPPPPLRNPIVPPGGLVPQNYRGQLFDYSVLAVGDELTAFREGVLPLGRLAFGRGPDAWHGDRLAVPVIEGVPLEELGVLLCAPQGTGKTHLLLSWAAAAAAAGRTVVMIDVKGNMRPELERALSRVKARPTLLEFSTDAYAASDRVNPLCGITADHPDCHEQLMRIADALLPADDFKGRGEEGLRHDLSVQILCGGLQVLKLMEWHKVYEFGRQTDLVDLQKLLAREDEILKWIQFLRKHEAWCASNKMPMPRYSVEECIDFMAIALSRQLPLKRPDGTVEVEAFLEGGRPAENTYKQYMVPIAKALNPFRPGGYMAERVRSFGKGEEIRLDQLGSNGKAPIVLIKAREEDSSVATAILDVFMRRLRQVLDRRRTRPPGSLGGILLLLDETRRIPGFNPAEFVSVVRQNKVGYVLVYQALDLIEPKEYAPALLRNIGTQIYLGGLSGTDLELFNRHRPQREMMREWVTRQTSSAGAGRSVAESGKEVPFLTPLAAERFPAGRFPALVAVRGDVAPFLIDLDDALPP